MKFLACSQKYINPTSYKNKGVIRNVFFRYLSFPMGFETHLILYVK